MGACACTSLANIIACRRVFTLMYHVDGTIDRYKPHLVVKGYTQTCDDYYEMFSPTARLNSIRIIFVLVVNLFWPMYQLDVKNVFSLWRFDPNCFFGATSKVCCSGGESTNVCRLKKAIYGLKQRPRAWFDKFSNVLGAIAFKECKSDHKVFVSFEWNRHSNCVRHPCIWQ